ncbi:putative DNA polymerase delta, subunit 4 [Lupinus albus]|uniref:Putative DNA polymerase delta, subunit 4 n=1 Tax=Lupinus albus TaxID=3870 RepID=A0A6A4Q8Z7_LUPAL|nr:putative DNA polymerase delta, subunit 4 [Lupinus albus]
MSSVSSNMKGFYRQKKNTITNKSSNKPPIHDAALSPSTTAHADEYNENETMLRQFDMNMAYGPCVGMSRKERLERAQKLGLNPPIEIKKLLENEKVQSQSLWDGSI